MVGRILGENRRSLPPGSQTGWEDVLYIVVGGRGTRDGYFKGYEWNHERMVQMDGDSADAEQKRPCHETPGNRGENHDICQMKHRG